MLKLKNLHGKSCEKAFFLFYIVEYLKTKKLKISTYYISSLNIVKINQTLKKYSKPVFNVKLNNLRFYSFKDLKK